MFPLVIVVWLLGLALGFNWLLAYEATPGLAASWVARWPEQSRQRPNRTVPTLLMFVHPKCPCSRASVSELAKLMAQLNGKIEARVLFVRPDGFEPDWEKTDIWNSAQSIPGVTTDVDFDGIEAHHFGSKNSGHVLLFSPNGEQLFSGGITISRGHVGENDGVWALLSIVNQHSTPTQATPVFGCELTTDLKPKNDCDAGHNN